MKWEILEQHSFPEDYIPLANALVEQSVFLSHQWFTVFLNTVVHPEDRVYWIGIKDAKNIPILLMPLWWKINQPKWHQRLFSLSNYYTTLYQPLYTTIDAYKLTQAMEAAITAICSLNWAVLEIYPLAPQAQHYQLLVNAFRQHKKHVTPFFMSGNWYFLTNGITYQEYLETCPSQLRNILKRKYNKLKKHKLEYQLYQTPDEIHKNIAKFIEVYNASWKKPEPYTKFIPFLSYTFATEGWIRLGLLYIDSEIAAAQIWFVVKNTAYIYKLCQKPEFDCYSPGSLLTSHIMSHAIDKDHVYKVDFLSGDEEYKKSWMSDRNEYWGLQITNHNSLYGLFQTICNYITKKIKKYI